jgi:succinate-semialdehyde dehydrogenase / glutarate-semialdehyde dehydrogenase
VTEQYEDNPVMTFQAINPTTGDVVSSYDEMPPDMVKGIVDDVNEAFLGWRRTSFTERAKLMRKAAETLRSNANKYALLMTAEMGKPVRTHNPP